MLSSLMLAQSQYLFYKLATDKKQSPEILSKVALQISNYFREAYSFSQMNRASKSFNKGQFANIMAYHDKYFSASAWLVLGISRFQKAKDEGHDMGVAAGTAKEAQAIFKSCEPIVAQIPPDYKDNFVKKLEQASNMAKMSEEKAKTVFFETVATRDKIKMPDSKNFVKFDSSCSEDFNKIPTMNETLRHVVPPQVRKMQGEFKT